MQRGRNDSRGFSGGQRVPVQKSCHYRVDLCSEKSKSNSHCDQIKNSKWVLKGVNNSDSIWCRIVNNKSLDVLVKWNFQHQAPGKNEKPFDTHRKHSPRYYSNFVHWFWQLRRYLLLPYLSISPNRMEHNSILVTLNSVIIHTFGTFFLLFYSG